MMKVGMADQKLTDRQRRFVNAYATNGQNGTAAARAAGYRGNDNVLGKGAFDLLRNPKIQKALRALTGKAIQRADRGAIASLQECLQFLTTVKRSRLGDFIGTDGEPTVSKIQNAPEGLVKKLKIRSTTDENGQVYAQHEIELESAQDAAKTLIRHYQDTESGKREGLFAAVLKKQPPAVIAAIARMMLAGPRALEAGEQAIDVTAIDVTAKRVG